MIHIYWGDGKGKTTAAMGLALRMAGRDQSVAIAQFMKGLDSGERSALALLPNVTLLDIPKEVKFSFALTREEFQAEADRSLRLLEEAAALAEAEAMDDGSSVSLDAFKAELEGYSGKLVLRIPRSLHKHLKEEAEIEGVSLNQYMLYKLSR